MPVSVDGSTVIVREIRPPVVDLAAADKGGITFSKSQPLYGQMSCVQAGAARGVDRQGRSAKIQVIRDPVGQHRGRISKSPGSFGVILKEPISLRSRGATYGTYMSRNGEHVMGDTRHVATDAPRPVVDSGVVQGKKGSLDELPGTEGHHSRFFGGDPKLNVIEQIDILQKRSTVCFDLPDCAAFGPVLYGQLAHHTNPVPPTRTIQY